MGILILWLSSWFVAGLVIYNSQTKKRWVMTVGGSFIASLVFLGLSTMAYQKITDSVAERATASIKNAEDQNHKFALAAAETEISKKLLSPASARYDMKVLSQEGNTYIVHATVDSQNAFGALLRGYFCARVEMIDAIHYKGGAAECMESPTPDYVDMLKYANF